MKKFILILTVLVTLSSISFADDFLSDCDSIEMECIQTSLWCDEGEAF